jgi:Tfp pilus assembly protein PilE
MAVLITFAVPFYEVAIEQSRADIAAGNLRAIWSAQRFYWLENHAYTQDLTQLESLGLLDPAIVLSATGYVYSVTSASPGGFQAQATRANGAWRGALTIDETGLVSGTLSSTGNRAIVPDFQ